jgi:hypothetical protein
VKPYPGVEGLVAPAVRVRMPRAPRVAAPGGTIHVVARCNNREFYFTTTEDFDCLLAYLRELVRTYAVTLYAYTLLSNHVHLLMKRTVPDTFCNHVGQEGEWVMSGKNMIVDPVGKILIQASGTEEQVVSAEIERESVIRARQRFLLARDRRPDAYGAITTITEQLHG